MESVACVSLFLSRHPLLKTNTEVICSEKAKGGITDRIFGLNYG